MEEVVFEVITETKSSTVSNVYVGTNWSLKFMSVGKELVGTN